MSSYPRPMTNGVSLPPRLKNDFILSLSAIIYVPSEYSNHDYLARDEGVVSPTTEVMESDPYRRAGIYR